MDDPLDPVLPDLEAAITALLRAVKRVEMLSTEEAERSVQLFAQGERLCVAGRTMAARQVERSGRWRRDGHRTAAHWMAEATGMAVGQAIGALETARQLEDLPKTAEAFRSGELSETKAREVASAASASPSSETLLLDAARNESVAALKKRCLRVKAAATERDQAYERIRQTRYLRHWTDSEGAMRLEARLTPDDGARVLAGLEPHRRRIFTEAWKAGRRESSQAYGADALVSMASESDGKKGPAATVHVRVDHSALVRGKATRGEVCDIPGIGPIPVTVAHRMASDSILKVLVADGADVRAVAHAGRTIPARVRTALEARDPTCVVPGCDVRQGLEIDHRIPFVRGGPTTLNNLARLCRWHHHLKTVCGYRLGGAPGVWTWTGPDPPAE